MATRIRPPTRSSTERSLRSGPASSSSRGRSPANDREKGHRHPINLDTTNHNPSLSTRRSSKLTPSSVRSNDERVSKTPPPQPALSSRKTSRKRPAAELSSAHDAPDKHSRAPTKLTVTQPQGPLVQTTNGVQTVLPNSNNVSGHLSKTKPNGASSRLKVPSTETQGSDKRSLRSQDGGSRLKSDLSIYFANYEDIIGDVPQPPEFLELETPIYVTDEPIQPPPPSDTIAVTPRRKSTSPNRTRKSKPKTPPPSTPASQSSTVFQPLNYAPISRHIPKSDGEDPLSDSVFFAAHRRAERKEKQLRNIEKERAMHEKVQLERLLDGLLGHDWLKVMGITGVTDGERKDWEPKRDYFIREVQALVDKFRIWKEEEKRLKMEKEAAQHAKEEAEEEENSEANESDSIDRSSSSSVEPHQRQPSAPRAPKPRRPPRPHGYVLPPAPPEPVKPFLSFFSKPHQREAALGKHRHGRKVLAFGHPVPEFAEQEFALPEEYLTPEALRDHARKRRRMKRESVGGVKKAA